jgi:hypothetical protein
MAYAWELTTRLLVEMKERSEEAGAEFLVTEPIAHHVIESGTEEGLILQDGYVMQYDAGKAFDRLARECREAGIDCYFPPLDWAKAKFRNDGHFTVEGTGECARLIVDRLEQLEGVFQASGTDQDGA